MQIVPDAADAWRICWGFTSAKLLKLTHTTHAIGKRSVENGRCSEGKIGVEGSRIASAGTKAEKANVKKTATAKAPTRLPLRAAGRAIAGAGCGFVISGSALRIRLADSQGHISPATACRRRHAAGQPNLLRRQLWVGWRGRLLNEESDHDQPDEDTANPGQRFHQL